MNRKLENASGLYLVGIRDGKPEQAIRSYTGHRYTQHSAGVKTGQAGFIEFFGAFLERNPKRDIEILRSIVDGRYVFVHVVQSLNDGEARWITMDMFDTDDDDRIIEHWDVIAPFTETPSGADPVGGESEPADLEQTEANKFRVNDFLKLAFVEAVDCFDEFVAGNLVQHSSLIDGGVDGWRRWQQAGVRYEFVLRVIGQGSFVAALSKICIDGRDHAGFNLFRLADGKIVEHWDCIEEIAPREQWANSGKF